MRLIYLLAAISNILIAGTIVSGEVPSKLNMFLAYIVLGIFALEKAMKESHD